VKQQFGFQPNLRELFERYNYKHSNSFVEYVEELFEKFIISSQESKLMETNRVNKYLVCKLLRRIFVGE